METIFPVVLCGGSGTRLWPLSRAGYPKQFLSFSGKETLFQQTVQRLCSACHSHDLTRNPLILGHNAHRFLILEQLKTMGVAPSAILLEPHVRNTAPALTLAALQAQEANPEAILVVTPSDHFWEDESAWTQSVQAAVMAAKDNHMVLLGLCPDAPETGYGYIHYEPGDASVCSVKAFVEKPDKARAQAYLDDGHYVWNAGVFVLKARVWLKALKTLVPDMHAAVEAAWRVRSKEHPFVRPDADLFAHVPADSIDYAVMEKAVGSAFSLKVIPMQTKWSDLGAWDAVWQSLPKTKNKNVTHGDVFTVDTENTLVHAENRLVGTLGVQDLTIVETADAVLVASHTHAQSVKTMVSQLKERAELTTHRKVYRPWGWYDTLDEGMGFKVKRIQVNPQASLSLQLHHQRAEHWVVVKGEAEVTNGEQVFALKENQSTYIPMGQKHRLRNRTEIPVELIEVQTGVYLGEDDIVRFEDAYDRVPSKKEEEPA